MRNLNFDWPGFLPKLSKTILTKKTEYNDEH